MNAATTGTAIERLQQTLREIFQLDYADLDFGLYRIFHLRRKEIEEFIANQLPEEVAKAFAEVSGQDRERLEAEVKRLAQQLRDNVADDAITPSGEVAQAYANTKLARQYAENRRRLQSVLVTEGHKAEVFNHLVNFFRRYYEDGDFIPKRRYGGRETYAVPYDGEEVFFYWPNRDQHYVKTHERFRDYAFKVATVLGEYRVRFTMAEASIAKDNTKGNTRFFFPRADLAGYDAQAREFVLPFEYRLPTVEEANSHGTNSKAQETILDEALEGILAAIPDDNLRACLTERADQSEEAPTVLLKRLRHFCRRNTSDYFIHRDLRGFLTRELEFYIKDQILHLMDLEADLDAKRRVVRTFKQLAERIIDLLAAIEDAQRTLFKKRKFVLGTDYLIPICHVPRQFWAEVLGNETQRAEWEAWGMLDPETDLFNPEGEANEAFLEAHPSLPVHTRHFDRQFVRRLLESLPFDDLDEATDGLLVHGENYQALNLLLERYREQVECIYIDPPYNTAGSSEIIYKNGYKHSSWLCLMHERLRLSRYWLSEGAVLIIAIDDTEMANLAQLVDHSLPSHKREVVVVNHHPAGAGLAGANVSSTHEYAIFLVPIGKKVLQSRCREKEEVEIGFMRTGTGESNLRIGRPNSFYAILVDPETGRVVGAEPPPAKSERYPTDKTCDGFLRIYPVGADGRERVWRRSYESFWAELQNGTLVCKNNKSIYLKTSRSRAGVKSNWTDTRYNAGVHGSNLLTALFGRPLFSYPKSVFTVYDAVDSVLHEGSGGTVLDFFAGSGTTGHAVINLNREDGGRRKFILMEMGEYFDTVLVPRIAKVMYAPKWKEGKPKQLPSPEEAERTPRVVKILRIESYEDALHNVAATAERLANDEEARRQDEALRELGGEGGNLLRYCLELPLREAQTCLRALDLRRPFDYRIEVLTDDGPVERPVELVETFNYLYGLRVARHETWRNSDDGDREYRVVKATDRERKRRILVVWRDMEGLEPETDRRFLEGRLAAMEAEGETWDEVLVNGDSPTPGVASLDPMFRRLMMAPEPQGG